MWDTLAAEGGAIGDALHRCAQVIEARAGWSLEQTLGLGVEHIAQDRVDAAIAAVQIALTEGWRSRGIVPHAVCARSSGEPAAEFGRGCLALEQALEAPMRWGRLIQERGGHSTMLMVRATLSQVAALRQASPVEFFVTADATDAVTVIACARPDVPALIVYLDARRIRHSATGFVTAPHSPLVESWKQGYVEPVVEGRPGDPRIAYYSAGAQVADSGTAYAQRMWQGVRAPVLMGRTLRRMIADGIGIFVEIGGRATLDQRIHARAAALGKRATVLPTMRLRQPAGRVMDETQAALRHLDVLPLGR